MAKVEVMIDEKWPIFSLEPPKEEENQFNVEIPDNLYREYLYIMYKYFEFQTMLKVYYDAAQARDKNT